MAQERLTLRKIREILRLKEAAGLSNRAIARVCKVSNSTVGEYLKRAEAAGLQEVPQSLFPNHGQISLALKKRAGHAGGIGNWIAA